ncbi:MAG TPA: YHS domain-containing protein [Planctomycetaceae bacterium]|nr:YHS domain-containing protein [Planctomycetaceae bacterium]HIQ21517.1 YHS domain-containing protein [Planctomycetota bacterium]
MSRLPLFLSLLATALFAWALAGCGGSQESGTAPSGDQPAEQAGAQSSAEHEHGEHAEHAEHGAAMAELPDEDRALAEKQKICPVSGEALGSMGTPFKIVHEGKTVFLCCEGCKDKFLQDPESYLAKLNQ